MARIGIFLCVFALSATCPSEGAAPRLTSTSNEVVYGTAGGTLTLSCKTANSSDSIAWYFNNKPVVGERGTLTLSQLRLEDGGWYTCAAANSFGRDERDFLLVVGEHSTEEVIFRDAVYRAPVGSRVELPCLFRGTPQPTIRWFEQNGDEISVTNGRYRIDDVTKSLVINGSEEILRMRNFSCLAQNQSAFGMDPVQRVVNVEFFTFSESQVPFSFPLNNMEGPVVLSGKPNSSLECTNLTNLAGSNYTVHWIRNFEVLPGEISNELSVNQSGYYCCNVSNPVPPFSYFCITVVDKSSSVPKVTVSSTNVSLPSNSNRTIYLLCTSSTPSGYAPPVIEWLDSHGNQLTSIEAYNTSEDLQYLVIRAQSDTDCTEGYCSTQYTCFGSNSFDDNASATVEIRRIALDACINNSLQGGNAELSNAEMRRYWSTTGVGASFERVHDENVFVLQYNDSRNLPSFRYSFTLHSSVVSVQLSGRIRQEGTGEALIELLVDGQNKCPQLVNPYPTLKSWQWVGCRLNITSASMTVVMTVRTLDSQSSVAGVAYFDDLCLTFDPRSGGLTDIEKYLIIGIGSGCGGLLVLFIVILMCCCVCRYCCCRKRKGNTKMMKKMSTLIKTKQSKVNQELKGVVGRYHSTNPVTQSKSEPVESHAYIVAAPQSKTDTIASYSHPGDRTYSAGQPATVVPSVVVERPPNQSGISASSPTSSARASVGVSTNQSNGQYTSLKREEIEMDNVYTTPVHSTQNPTDSDDDSDHEEDEYVNVEDGTSPSYLHLISSALPDGEGFNRSISGGRHSPSSKLPLPLPPLSTGTQIYENSQEVVPSGSSVANGAFSYTSPGNVGLPTKVQTLPARVASECQQIYENSQELVPSSSAVFNEDFRHTSTTNVVRSPSPRLPPISTSVEADRGIYENSQDVMLLEDTGEDIYENDLPGMNLQSPENS